MVPGGTPGEILKLLGEAMSPYLARFLEVSLNNATIPMDSKIAIKISIYKGGYRLVLSIYRPIRLTSVVYRQLGHVIARYLRHVWDKNDLLHK